VLILLATQRSDLLPTVASRCQQIRFHPVPHDLIRERLEAVSGLPSSDAEILSALAGGSIERAFQRANSGWLPFRRKLLEEMAGLAAKTPVEVLALAEHLGADKERAAEALDILECWLRDLSTAPRAPEKIVNRDLTDTIQCVSQKVAVSSLMNRLRVVQTAQRDVLHNVNTRLMMEALLLEMAFT
jgi:DNA polymerase-3 subunit delta'